MNTLSQQKRKNQSIYLLLRFSIVVNLLFLFVIQSYAQQPLSAKKVKNAKTIDLIDLLKDLQKEITSTFQEFIDEAIKVIDSK